MATNYWFTADQHRGHEKVIVKGNRPFSGIAHQDEVLDDEWRTVVKPQDVVFVLGDFSFYKASKTDAILKGLPGQKWLIKGNHDSSKENAKVTSWHKITSREERRLNGDLFVLDHHPILSWRDAHWGSYHLHGHCHGNMKYPEMLQNSRIMDVGVDAIAARFGKYRPISLDEVVSLLESKGPTYSAHHKA
jgi:calcineurin-like phosphoesterase family protein